MCRSINPIVVAVIWCWMVASCRGQSGTRSEDFSQPAQNGSSSRRVAEPALGGSSSRMMAEPAPLNNSPYLPQQTGGSRLPVAGEGFCLVTLRDHHRWTEGNEHLQLIFDGQIYWFASSSQLGKFAANPGRYVPALQGDCVVTFAESNKRVMGKPQHGLIHDGRVFFFSSNENLERFRNRPGAYSKVDVANSGNCLVSSHESEMVLPGMPETLVIVDGKRYFFAGIAQQKKFLANLTSYGVTRTVKAGEGDPETAKSRSPVFNDTELVDSDAKPIQDSKTPVDLPQAMQGYCSVSIRTSGEWKIGNPEIYADFDGKRYQFASLVEQEAFLTDPDQYVPAFGGDCPVTKSQTNRRVPGSVFHPSIYQGRLFLFAGGKEKQDFRSDPGLYAKVDLAADGNCIVSSMEENKAVQGKLEHMKWHQGMRYFFSSAANVMKFEEDPEKFIDP